MIEPTKGRVYDPCCGTGGFFVQSEKFIGAHQGRVNDIAIYGQERNHTTFRLARMNLAIRGVFADIRWNGEGTLLRDAFPDERFDYVLAKAPVQVEDIEALHETLADRQLGGVIFSTIQKFRPRPGESEFPLLTERSNVVVFVDEAHRSQYGFDAKLDPKTGEVRYGFAHHLRRALPNATYVGFTGTPVELVNANTYGVFGNNIDVYDVTQAVEDGATVPIYYEARVARVEIASDMEDLIDAEFEDITEDIDETAKDAAAKRWGRVEALVGADKRLDVAVADILDHFEKRQAALDGKAMIVAMSRRIAVAIYERN